MKTIAVIIFPFLILLYSSAIAQISLRPDIQTIVNKLREEPVLHIGLPVGFAGLPETHNKYYKLYKKLDSLATNEELVMLTNDSSKVIVLYSFDVLTSRDYFGLKDVFIKHLNDTSNVWIASGCTNSKVKINYYMLGNINPKYYPTEKSLLTKKEFDDYLAFIKKNSESQ